MKKILVALIIVFAMMTGTCSAEVQKLGGRWLLDGAGFAERGVLRVSLTTNGDLDIVSSSDPSGNEKITEYKVRGELNASRLNINTWKYAHSAPVNPPLTVNKFNPTLNEPYRLPSFTIQELTYTVELTSTTSGTVKIRGFVDIDNVGKCEINADCALWKEGTPKPDIPNSKSGCNSGVGGALLLIATALYLIKLHKGSRLG